MIATQLIALCGTLAFAGWCAGQTGEERGSQPPGEPAGAGASDAPEVEPPAMAPERGSDAGAAADAGEASLVESIDGVAPAGPSDPRPPTGAEAELEQIRLGALLKKQADALEKATRLRLGAAYTMLFQQATGGPGRRSAASGDLDLLAKWTALGYGTKDTGIVALATEYRHQIGDQPPSDLGGQIGTLVPTTNGFGERPFVVKELYWDHRLFNDRARYAIGRIDPENIFGGHRLQSANTFFLYKAFSSNVTVAYPGPALAAAGVVRPTTWSYIGGGFADANGKATTAGFDTFFDENEYLTFGEAGLTPTFDGLGSGRYRLALWHIDAREEAGKPSDRGVTVAGDQELGERLIAFARYGHADGDVTGITDSVQGGVAIKGVLGEEHLLGLAGAWSRPSSDAKRDETAFEVFQRFQLTETFQLTVGAQLILDPGSAPDDDALGVFSVRARFAF